VRLLLDTCAFIWLVEGMDLPPDTTAAIASADNDVFLSAASCWEIATKNALGRLPLSAPPEQAVPRVRERHRIASLAIEEESAFRTDRLPRLHKDPFDRLLVAQALTHDLTIVTPDPLIAQYGVKTLW
jgi:PIN domain nuclease of toxin-antitoxin system